MVQLSCSQLNIFVYKRHQTDNRFKTNILIGIAAFLKSCEQELPFDSTNDI